MSVAILLLVAVLASGGVSVAAEQAVPGDLLYPVKIRVNENVRAAAAVSGEANAAWEVRRAERRLEELETVLSEDAEARVDAITEARAALDVQMDRTRDRIAAVEARGDDAAVARLRVGMDAGLAAHERILRAITTVHAEEATAVGILVAAINRERSVNAQERTDAEVRVGMRAGPEVRAAAEAQRKVAAKHIAKLSASLDDIAARGSVSAEVIADARAQLDVAVALFADAQASLDAQADGDAFITFQEAHQIAHRAQVTITRADALQIRLLPPVAREANGASASVTGDATTAQGNTDAALDARAWIEIRVNALRELHTSLRGSANASSSDTSESEVNASGDGKTNVELRATVGAEQKTTVGSGSGETGGTTDGTATVDTKGTLKLLVP